MKKHQPLAKSVFYSAIVTGVVWHVVNGLSTVDGEGWCERQPFPLNHWPACVVIIALLVAISGQISAMVRRNRRLSMESAAVLLGLSFESSVTKSGLGRPHSLRVFDHWDQGLNLMQGVVNNMEVAVFDLHKKIGSNRQMGGTRHTTSREERQTVFVFQLPRSSEFRMQLLRKRDLSFQRRMMGYDGVKISPDGDTASEAVRELVQQFNRDVMVTQGWSDGTIRTSTDLIAPEGFLAGVEKYVSLKLMRHLLSSSGWNLELGESHVAVWMQNRLHAPSAIRHLLSEAQEICRLLSVNTESGRGTKLTASGVTSVGEEMAFKSFAWIAGGGCLGMVTAVVVMIPLFLLSAETSPRLVVAFPVVSLVLMIVGVRIAVVLRNK